jgi:hypothetical protein
MGSTSRQNLPRGAAYVLACGDSDHKSYILETVACGTAFLDCANDGRLCSDHHASCSKRSFKGGKAGAIPKAADNLTHAGYLESGKLVS